MSSYVNIELSEYNYNQVLDAIECATMHSETFSEVAENVHLLDYIEEEYDRDKGKQNKEYQRWAKQQELLRDNEKPNPELFLKIQVVLDKYDIEFDFNDQFHCICDLVELFDEYKEKELQGYLR